MKQNRSAALAVALALAVSGPVFARAQEKPAAPAEAKATGVLKMDELEKLIPPSVYFQGQSATVQLRNSGGIRFANGEVMLAVKVDTGGYSTSVKERYQDYLITETALQLGEGTGAKTLAPGAYGIGFVADGLLVMDIGGHTLFTLPTPVDKDLRRPAPLQVLASGDSFRLYSGRTFINFRAAPTQAM
jgi:hypothetical protein